MIALVDSSVILRKILGEPNPLSEWRQIQEAYGSRILQVELSRVIDRLRLESKIDDDDVVQLHQESRRLLRSIEILALSERILDRAAAALPIPLGTLDSLHLATALDLATLGRPIVLATHDTRLARTARACGLEVCGA